MNHDLVRSLQGKETLILHLFCPWNTLEIRIFYQNWENLQSACAAQNGPFPATSKHTFECSSVTPYPFKGLKNTKCSLNILILCTEIFFKMVTKSRCFTKFNVTRSQVHCIWWLILLAVIFRNIQPGGIRSLQINRQKMCGLRQVQK